ncbi:hypothetical protein BLNAU_21750 [Blattamonas nauphoetae]|uniref:Uncharacterized protein n=1 Tax=Blattamonas nauphoetae TaxID=2049346 RepID=A0ABQ9WV15_9EUKA|nr:hypothetical protein BLNAU_21750 [Blattamonas nauphoetae]
MTDLNTEIITSTDCPRAGLSSPCLSHTADCSPFLNWTDDQTESIDGWDVVFRSLVATVKLQPALDVSLEEKTVDFLEFVSSTFPNSLDLFLDSFASNSDESLTNFVQSIVVLISSPNLVITTAAMEMLRNLFVWCSNQVLLALVQADLIPQIINTLNPQSLSFAETVDLYTNLMITITNSLCLSTPTSLGYLAFEDGNEQQAVHEAVLKQVVVPPEKYICHLCVNRFSIIDEDQSKSFLSLLAQLLDISPSYQPTMNIVLHTPVILTIPSSLAFIEHDHSIWAFLYFMVDIQREWNEPRGKERQTSKVVNRMLRMEGIEDGIEEKLQNDPNNRGSWIVTSAIGWNHRQGMNRR